MSGSRDDFAHTHINDIGLVPVAHAITGEMGFNVMLGVSIDSTQPTNLYQAITYLYFDAYS